MNFVSSSLYLVMRQWLMYGFIAFYTLVCFGFKGNLHFCCGELRSASLVGFSTQKSCCKPSAHRLPGIRKKQCCENVQIAFEKSGAERSISSAKIPDFNWIIAPVKLARFVFVHRPEEPVFLCGNQHPPDLFAPPLFIRHCVFRI